MKTLILDKFSILTLPVIIFFRIFNFKILFFSIEKYFRNKVLLKSLSLINIKWFNYQEYKINNIEVEKLLKASIMGDKLSSNISNKFWIKNLEGIYDNEHYFSACLNRRIWTASQNIIEILSVAKKIEENNNKIFLWIPNTLIFKKINFEFYHFKNLNFFPSFQLFEIFSMFVRFSFKELRKIIKNLFNSKTNNQFKVIMSNNEYQNFEITYFPHKSIFYSNLFLKDFYYSNDEKDPFFSEKILHIEWEKKDVNREVGDYYKKNNIKYLIWNDLSQNLIILKKIIFFSIVNSKLLFNLIKFDFEILKFFLISTFIVLQSLEKLSKLKNLKLALIGHDLPFPAEISIACKKKNIITIAIQDRVAISKFRPLMVFDYYFVGGEKTKNLTNQRMPKPFIENILNLYLVKVDKYKKGNIETNSLDNSKNNKLKCLVIDLNSVPQWYENGRSPTNNWRLNKEFYQKIIKLAKNFSQIDFLIKSKNYEWLEIPYFKEILIDLNLQKNIIILSDTKKWTTAKSAENCDFAIAIYSSLSDEILAMGKPAIIFDWCGNPEKYFDFGKILAKNYQETLDKVNLIYKDYKKYNSEIDQDRNEIYFKAQPGKLNSELNKIFLSIKDNKS